jgi:hypothetical protein
MEMGMEHIGKDSRHETQDSEPAIQDSGLQSYESEQTRDRV